MRTLLSVSLLLAATATQAMQTTPIAGSTELSIYHSDDDALFNAGDNGAPSGYAMVREPRSLTLQPGLQDVSLDNLPGAIDSNSLALTFGDARTQVLSQQLQLGQGSDALLRGLIGQTVDVLGDNGQTLAQGTLLAAGDNLLLRDADGSSQLFHHYASIKTHQALAPGASLHLRINAARAGVDAAHLSYATAGIGWRASYVGTLVAGKTCQLQLDARASIANRSGRDWHDASLLLVAGEPRMEQAAMPRPMMMMKTAAAPVQSMPRQAALGDLRSYRLANPVNLPNDSVSQLPLYPTGRVDCERTALYEGGSGYRMNRPNISADFNPGQSQNIISMLSLKAPDNLPAGQWRTVSADEQGVPQLLGQSSIADTPKGSEVQLTLGNAFDLRAERERTAFHVDTAARTMHEAFRIHLSNAGEHARVVTVREHPARWHQWKLASSSLKPSQQTPDTLEFQVSVPAAGSIDLDYAVHYQWTADEQPQ